MDTNKFIKEMSSDLEPVKPIHGLLTRLPMAIAISLGLIFLAILILGGFRYDISAMLQKNHFLVTNIGFGFSAFFATWAMFQLSVPDIYIRTPTKILLTMASLIWVPTLIHTISNLESEAFLVEWHYHKGLVHHCAIETFAMMLPPVILFFYLLRKAAPVRINWVSYACFLSASSFATIAMRCLCAKDTAEHLFLWHYMPAVFLCLTGAFICRRFLRW